MPVVYSMLAIAVGAAIGANIRWLLSLGLNSFLPMLPPGTLVANLLGGFLAGIATAAFASMPELSAIWKAMIVTGFLGALTTFSTFSAEIYTQLQDGRLLWAFAGIVTHVAGSLLMTGLGIALFAGLRHLLAGHS